MMKRLRTVALLAALAPTATPAVSQGTVWTFDEVPAGRPPSGFSFASEAEDQPGRWVLFRDGANGVLAHMQQASPAVQLAVAAGAYEEVVVSARVRFAEGARSAGLVWRYRDPNNYYLMALDLQAQDVRVYRVVGGNRTRLDQEDKLELDPGLWHTLKIEDRGMRIRVWINGVPVVSARVRTESDPGAAGVWTRGDAVTWFDDVRVEPARVVERINRRD